MLVGWVWLLVVASQGCASASQVNSSYAYGDKCTNLCDDNDNSDVASGKWCNERKIDPEGFMSRCVQFTRYDHTCITGCQQSNEKYKWCYTNNVMTSGAENWDYCAEEGLTINNEMCKDACEKRDKDYFYCHTAKSWDYCSPHGRVKPIQLNIKGSQCKGECGYHGEKYTWCSKNLNYCKSAPRRKCDDWWEYCSLDNMHTRYGEQCKDECAMRGEDYYWCSTADTKTNWDYCSAKVEDGVHLSLKKEFDVYGKECMSVCSTFGENYFWCTPIGSRDGNWWDYCAKEGMTRYNEPCKNECKRRGQDYFWCKTESSWDYCSPTQYHSGATSFPSRGFFAILALGIIGATLNI